MKKYFIQWEIYKNGKPNEDLISLEFKTLDDHLIRIYYVPLLQKRIIEIVADTPEECEEELESQYQDGIFENEHNITFYKYSSGVWFFDENEWKEKGNENKNNII